MFAVYKEFNHTTGANHFIIYFGLSCVIRKVDTYLCLLQSFAKLWRTAIFTHTIFELLMPLQNKSLKIDTEPE